MSAAEPADVERLRKAFAALESDETAAPVAPDRIFDAVHGDTSAEDRQALVDEILINPAAAEAWRLARELTPGAADGLEPGTTMAPPRPATLKWASVAAAAVLATGLGWQWFQRGAEEPTYRSVESRTIVSALSPDADISRAEPVLRWTGIPGARYRVRVLTADLQVLEESDELSSPQYTLGQQTLARIPAGDQILWQVDARMPGEVIVTSPTFTNHVP